MAIARSFRAENEREVVNFDAVSRGEMALVGGALESDGSQLQVYVGYQPRSVRARAMVQIIPLRDRCGRSVNRSGEPGPPHRHRVGREWSTSVLFGADDIELVFGPPSVRRRFLDILLSQTDSSYVRSLQRYQKVVRQRNRLLKAVGEGRAEYSELEFWTDQLVADGAGITRSRNQALVRLGPLATQKHRRVERSRRGP